MTQRVSGVWVCLWESSCLAGLGYNRGGREKLNQPPKLNSGLDDRDSPGRECNIIDTVFTWQVRRHRLDPRYCKKPGMEAVT